MSDALLQSAVLYQEISKYEYYFIFGDKKKNLYYAPSAATKTRVQIREDTELKNFPLFCPKCHKQTLINAKQLNITTAEVPDAKTQSR